MLKSLTAGGRLSPAEAEFRTTWKRELSQRSDAGSAFAASSAASTAARTLLAERWAATQAADAKRPRGVRRVHYLSMEFLMGRAMHNALAALKLDDKLPTLLGAEAPSLQRLVEHEPDAALGNGGLGVWAAEGKSLMAREAPER